MTTDPRHRNELPEPFFRSLGGEVVGRRDADGRWTCLECPSEPEPRRFADSYDLYLHRRAKHSRR